MRGLACSANQLRPRQVVDLDRLREFAERSIVVEARERRFLLGNEGVEEGALHDGKHVERTRYVDIGFTWVETEPDVAVSPDANTCPVVLRHVLVRAGR